MTRASLAALALAAALVSPAAAESYLQAEPKTFEVEGAKRIRTEFPIGAVKLEGDDGSTVRVQVRIDCKNEDYEDCKDAARRVRIDHSVTGDQFRLEFSGIHKDWSGRHVTVHAHVLVPRTLAADLNM